MVDTLFQDTGAVSEFWCEYFKNGVFTGISTESYSGAVLSACLFVYLFIYLLAMFAHMLFVTEQFLGSAFSVVRSSIWWLIYT